MGDRERRRLSSLGKENWNAFQASSSKHSRRSGQDDARTPLQASSSRVNRDVRTEATLRTTPFAPTSSSKRVHTCSKLSSQDEEQSEAEGNQYSEEITRSSEHETSDAETIKKDIIEHTNANLPSSSHHGRRRVRWYNNANQSLRSSVYPGVTTYSPDQDWDESVSEEDNDSDATDNEAEHSGKNDMAQGNSLRKAPEDIPMDLVSSDSDDNKYYLSSSSSKSDSDESMIDDEGEQQDNSGFTPIHFTHGKFNPSTRLSKHLNLEENGDKALDAGGALYLIQARQRKKRAKEYLHLQEERLYNQLCLLAPDVSRKHNNNFLRKAKKCFDDVRPFVLDLLSKISKYIKCGYVLLFCEYACFSSMRDGQNGACLFLMSDCEHITSLLKDIQSLVVEHEYGGCLDVIVQKGTPTLFGVGASVKRAFKRVSAGLRGGRSSTSRESSESGSEAGDNSSSIGGRDSREDIGTNIGNHPCDEEEYAEKQERVSPVKDDNEEEKNSPRKCETQSVQPTVDNQSINDIAEQLHKLDRELAGLKGVPAEPQPFMIIDEGSDSEREDSKSPASLLAEVESASFDLHIPYDPDWNKENIPPRPSRSPPQETPSPDMEMPGLRSALRPIRTNIQGEKKHKPTPSSAKSNDRKPLKEIKTKGGDGSILRGINTVASPREVIATEVIPGVIRTRQRTGYQLDQRGFHYGLRYITNIAIPAPEEGMQADYHRRPNIGESLGHVEEKNGCGTLAGYLIDEETGEHFAVSAFHVVSGNKKLVHPLGDGPQVGTVATAPAASDFGASIKSASHIKTGLLGEFYRSAHFGDKAMALYIKQHEGDQALENVMKYFKRDGNTPVDIRFGEIIASSWTIRNRDDAKYLVDIGVIKPIPDRLGRNTFTYMGRDNEHGRRYRLEAAGWARPALGEDVLKVGRTTGLTKGTVISTDADMRLSIGVAKGDTYYWEVNCSVATAGSEPWFSEAGDSGSFILHAPSIESMQRHEKKHPLKPIPTPVVGLLFGGADSVEGVHLTFFNDSSLIKSELKRLTGRKLVPGSFLGQDQYDAKGYVNSELKSGGLKTPIGSRKDDPMGITAPDHPFRKTVSFEEIVKMFPPPHPKDRKLVRKEPIITKLDGRKKDIHEPKRKSEFASVRTRTPSPSTPTPDKCKKRPTRRGARKPRSPPTENTAKEDKHSPQMTKVKETTTTKEYKPRQKTYISGSPKRAPVYKASDGNMSEFDKNDEGNESLPKAKLKAQFREISSIEAAHSSNKRHQVSKNSIASIPSPERSRHHSRISPHSVDGMPIATTARQVKSRSKVKDPSLSRSLVDT